MVGGLIENQKFRLGNQGVGKGDTLQLSAGELAHLLVEVTDFELRKDLFGFLFVFPGFLLIHTCQEVFQSRMPFGLHTAFIFLDKFYGAVTMMEAGFEYGQFFGVLRVLFQIIHTKVTAENDASAIVAFLSGDDIQ